jgi:ThiF family
MKHLKPLKIGISDDSEVTLDGVKIGIVNPASLWYERNGMLIVQGVGRLKKIDLTSGFNAIRDMVAIGAILLGNADEINITANALNEPTTSRTAVYLLNISDNLKHFCTALKLIQNSHVAIVGCGGIGSSSAYLMAGAGVRRLTLIDGDSIENSNFNRQPFWTNDTVGRLKSKVLKNELERRFNGLSIATLEIDVSSILYDKNSCLMNIDVAIISVDTPLGVNIKVGKFLEQIGVPFVGGGYSHSTMVVYDEISELKDEDENDLVKWKPCANRLIAPSFGPSNFEIAGLVSNRALQIISKLGLNRFGSGQSSNSKNFPRIYEK